MADSIREVLERRLRANLPKGLQSMGDAWAAGVRREAPTGLTGDLIRSVSFVPTGGTDGALAMVVYGPRVATSTPTLSTGARAAAGRQRYAARVGHTPQHPNDFIRRGWDSPEVAAAKEKFGAIVFSTR